MPAVSLAILLVHIPVLNCSPANEDGHEVRQTNMAATLEVRPAKAEVARGTDAEIEVILRNDDTRPLWVNGRLLVNSPHVPQPHREIQLLVLDPRGIRLDFACKVQAGEASAEEYAVLEPGQSLSARVYLNECFDMTREGIYRITAIYEDGTESVPAPPEDFELLRGPIQSPEAQLRVVPTNSR
jgi:hypothetical protein